MKKFKDFLYDKNDILIALLILIVAALIITWRMNAIMEYPSTILNSSVSGEDQSSGDGGQSGEAAGTDGDGVTADGSSTDDGSASAGSGDTSGGDESSSAGTEALWANGALTRDVQVTVTGASATEAIQCLVDAGLFDDYAEYQAQCESAGLDHQRVSAGTFTFEAGATKADITRTVNWS